MQVFYGIRVDGTRRPTRITGAWSHTAYERAVKHWLDRIMSTCTGRAVVSSLKPQQVVIEPDAEERTPTGGPEAQTRAAIEAGYRAGLMISTRSGALIGVGSGHGTSAKVEFTPADFINAPPHDQPDMVLIHELAMRRDGTPAKSARLQCCVLGS